MVSRWRVWTLWVVLATFILNASLGRAVAAEAARDPEGARHAQLLVDAYEKSGTNAKQPAFLALFDKDPNLTRRAFLPLLEMSRDDADPRRAATLKALSVEMARLCLERFDDGIPNLIIEVIEQKNPDAEGLSRRYTAFLLAEAQSGLGLSAAKSKAYGPYSDSYILVDTAADYSKDQMAAASLFHTKGLRYKIAYLMGNLPQVALEHDTFPAVQARLKEMGTSEAAGFSQFLASSVFRDDVLGYYERRLALESGLISKVKPDLDKMVDDSEHFSWRATTLYLSCAWAAAEQARVDTLQEMLGRARLEMSQDEEISRHHVVLRYVLATLEYRLQRLQGLDPSEADVLKAFQKAFNPLETYRPMARASVDATWMEGRPATRFWIDELARFPESGPQIAALIRINETWYRWWDRTLNTQLPSQTRDDRIVKYAFVDAFYSLGPNFFDQLTYRWVKFPRYLPDREELEWVEGALNVLPEEINWMAEGETGEGFPTFDLSSAGLIPEMRARLRLVEARMPDVAPEKRATLLEESVTLARAATQPTGLAEHLIAAGSEFQKLGKLDRAIACWNETVQLTEQIPLVEASFDALLLLSRHYLEKEEWVQAAHYAELATQKLEAVSPLVGTRSVEARRWSQELVSITALAARAHIGAASPEKALAALTRGSQLQSAALQVEGDPLIKPDADELRRQQQGVQVVTEQVARLEAQPMSALRDSLLEETRQQLANNKAEYLVKSREIRQKHSALYSQALKFDPLDLPNLQKHLPADVAVLQFFPTEDTLYTFAMTKDSFRLQSSAVSAQDLDSLVLGYLRAVRRNLATDDQLAAQSRKLYEVLIAPSVGSLAGKSSVVVIPAGRLHGLPFAALLDERGEPLVQKWRLLELAKSTDLARLSQSSSGPIESVVAFANATGDLPAAQVEGEKVVTMFPKGKLFESKDATKANLLSYGSGAQVLHLATHGEWNIDDSLQNYLTMAGSQKMAQEEIFQLSLENTSIVVLSACNTAMGEGSEKGYVASLAEAFWLAGSHSVLASLWAVNDRSTSLLMETFYQRLQAGDDKAQALRAAQQAVRAVKGFEHPYYWAGFVLFGER